MKRVVLVSLVAACVVAANPVFVTYLSEFSSDPAHQWLELHVQPEGYGYLRDLDTRVLRTSASVCTLEFLPDDTATFVVIDSQSLAQGSHGHGAFRLNPDSDIIVLVRPPANPFDSEFVRYPRLPADYGKAPDPPRGGSACFWWDDNWYIDSTTTPGAANRLQHHLRRGLGRRGHIPLFDRGGFRAPRPLARRVRWS